ncbi:serine acetyltransferase [Sphingomonas sp. DBB INV C78]|uniref:serine O-acetyltransferase EpsC n=1 Tax=Sphingomonas sp. DBB INV C78 TaxID=3349434 RepID=UPI0036D2EC1D
MSTDSAEPHWQIERLVDELRSSREAWRHKQARHRELGPRGFPSRAEVERLAADISGALFPQRLGPPDLGLHQEDYYVGHILDGALNSLLGQLRLELRYSMREAGHRPEEIEIRARVIARDFADSLPAIREILDSDVEAAYAGDPAARSVDEVLLCYPCVSAIIHHRLAHRLHDLGAPLIARLMSEIANSRTGIDIHPGARIGRSFFIDHGTGVVIGETAVIGDRVRLYQAVTLGAKSFAAEADGSLRKGEARHPSIEDDVIVYAGATILGRVIIGAGSVIGGNVWLTESLPPGSHVTQASLTRDPAARSVPPWKVRRSTLPVGKINGGEA